jgi:predicted RNA methylase
VDDKTLKPILADLYYPKSPYEFSVLPAEILGNVYEQFLGKVIHLTDAHHAKVEEKPEVKKAGGVYYTPSYIVEYIVKNTVGKQIEGKSPGELKGFRVLDPACGSGSFLLGAYTFLLEYYRDWYTIHEPGKKKDVVAQQADGSWQLTLPERKRILTEHIFGVDIDRQAVEVTKLSLLLKVLEGVKQLTLLNERALPNLDYNIKCGNSLIGPDYFSGHLMPDDDELRHVNPFDWKKGFPEAIEAGGFECVIGNPPWGAEFQENEKRYLDHKFSLNTGKYESYIYFVELATRRLVKGGLFGFIIPTYWVSRSQTESLRKRLSVDMTPEIFIVLPENVFTGVKMDACIVVAQNTPIEKVTNAIVRLTEISDEQIRVDPSVDEIDALLKPVALQKWANNPELRFNPRIVDGDYEIIHKVLDSAIRLEEIVELTQGLTLYRKSTLTEKFGKAKAEEIVEKRLFHANRKKDRTFKKELLGRDVARYHVTWNCESWVSYGPWLAHAVDERFFKGPRLVIQKIRNPVLIQRLVVGYLDDDETYSAGVLLNAIPRSGEYSLFYVMGLLNSKLVNYWYRKNFIDVSIRVVDLKQVPIRSINFSELAEKARHDKMVSLVEQMLDLHKRKAESKDASEQERLHRVIDSTDQQIDTLVYELYGLTLEEIVIVESTAKG